MFRYFVEQTKYTALNITIINKNQPLLSCGFFKNLVNRRFLAKFNMVIFTGGDDEKVKKGVH